MIKESAVSQVGRFSRLRKMLASGAKQESNIDIYMEVFNVFTI